MPRFEVYVSRSGLEIRLGAPDVHYLALTAREPLEHAILEPWFLLSAPRNCKYALISAFGQLTKEYAINGGAFRNTRRIYQLCHLIKLPAQDIHIACDSTLAGTLIRIQY